MAPSRGNWARRLLVGPPGARFAPERGGGWRRRIPDRRIRGDAGGQSGAGAAGGAAGVGVDGGGCGVQSPPPPPGSHLDCPLDPSCAGSYAAQLAKIEADGGACQGFAPIEVTTATCGGKQVWRKAATFSVYECIYSDTGALLGSENCGDTGCILAGDVINDDATKCADGGRSPNLCAADASTD